MKKSKNYIRDVITALTAILIYFSFSYIQLFLLDILHIDYQNMSLTFKVIYLIVTEIIEMVLIISLFYKKLKENYQDLKKNHEVYFKTYFKYWLFILAVMAISNVIITFITSNQTSANEETFRELMVKSPIYAYFSGVIFAPIIEELIFRRGIRNIIPNNTVFILVSGIIFGGLHVVTGYSGPLDLLYLIPYCTPGLVFAYILTKTDNVLVTASIHFMHNGILIALEMFIYLFLS
jgi:membrane protease YdiL (CAAX protease family)